MVIVSDTSVLIALDFLGRVQLLNDLYGHVLVPPAVRAEFLSRPGVTTSRREVFGHAWIECRAPGDRERVGQLRIKLHAGEAEAIALALEVGADTLLIDETRGRKAATELGLKIVGVVGILLRAKRAQLLPCIRSELDSLRSGLGFRISEAVYEEAVSRAGEGV